MMALAGSYLGMDLLVDDIDEDNAAYFGHCAAGRFCLQSCAACRTLRYPPAPRCPVCRAAESAWRPITGAGVVFTYTVIHQATQPRMKPHAPYAVLIVELDAQPERPLRVPGILVDDRCMPLRATGPRDWGIGTRVRMRFARADAEDGIALPVWSLDR